MKHIYLLLILLITFSSCRKDDSLSLTINSDEQEVEMKFMSPITYSSPSEDDVEKRIMELDLLVFKDGKYQYSREAYVSDNDYTTYRSVLRIDGDLTLFFFANCRSALNKCKEDGFLVDAILDQDGNIVTDGTAWSSDLFNRLTMTEPIVTVNGKNALPMWGQLKNVTVTDQVVNKLGYVKLLRGVAAAEVYFAVDETEFQFTDVYLYNPANKAFMVPSFAANYPDDIEITSTNCPEDMTTGYRTDFSSAIEDQAVTGAIFMFENDTDEGKGRKQTRLVVGGFLAGDTKKTYYPMDFQYIEEGQTSPNVMKVLRNRKFVLTVTGVKSGGWETPDEAAKSSAVNLDYQVIDWDMEEDGEIKVDGPYYLSLGGDKKVTLSRFVNSFEEITMRTNGDIADVDMDFIGEDNEEIKNADGIVVGIKNDLFKAEIIMDAEDEVTHLRFTALKDWAKINNSDPQQTFYIRLERISFEVQVKQVDSDLTDWNNGGDEGTTVGKVK